MARTLACLVASMTVGAAILDWFQPSRPAEHLAGRQLIAQLREAVYPQVQAGTILPNWCAIRIDPQNESTPAGRANAHIIVGRGGNWTLTDNWRTQNQLGENGVVRIALLAPAHSNEVTPVQWEAATQLIQCFQQMCGIPGGGVVLNDTLALPLLTPASPAGKRPT